MYQGHVQAQVRGQEYEEVTVQVQEEGQGQVQVREQVRFFQMRRRQKIPMASLPFRTTIFQIRRSSMTFVLKWISNLPKLKDTHGSNGRRVPMVSHPMN